ncbi:hypothetical protein TSOC_008144, partial [Tetrabaena socialis]
MHTMAGVSLARIEAQQAQLPVRRSAVAVIYTRAWRQLHGSCRNPTVVRAHRAPCPAARWACSGGRRRSARAGSAAGGPLSGGPLATYQGSAQAPGLLKKRSQDYFANIEFDGDVDCSRSWLDERPRESSEAGCADCNSTGMVSRTATTWGSAGVPPIFVTGVFDGH